MRKILAAALFFTTALLMAAPAAAQTPQVEAGKPFGVAATHDGLNVDNFDVIVQNGTGGVVLTQSKPASALAAGEIQFLNLTAPARGTYTVIVRARNDDGLFADSDPLTFQTVKGKPNKPGKPRIVSGLLALLEKFVGFFAAQHEGFGPVRIIQ